MPLFPPRTKMQSNCKFQCFELFFCLKEFDIKKTENKEIYEKTSIYSFLLKNHRMYASLSNQVRKIWDELMKRMKNCVKWKLKRKNIQICLNLQMILLHFYVYSHALPNLVECEKMMEKNYECFSDNSCNSIRTKKNWN